MNYKLRIDWQATFAGLEAGLPFQHSEVKPFEAPDFLAAKVMARSMLEALIPQESDKVTALVKPSGGVLHEDSVTQRADRVVAFVMPSQ